MQEYDLFQEEFEQSINKYSLFENIDKWEKESIEKIQLIAETARIDLQQITDKSKEELLKVYHNIIIKFRSTYETNIYSENELNQSMEQLKQLQKKIISLLSDKFIENKSSINNLITTQDNSIEKNLLNSMTQDRFSKVIGSIILDEQGLLAKHTDNDWNYEYVLGEQFYSKGRHTILFKIDQSGMPYNIFFGCISSQAIRTRISINSLFTVGWFGYNQVYEHGIHINNPSLHGYNSNQIAINDILHLIFDCEKKQIELVHEDTNKRHVIQVNISKAPFPWQFLMVLTDKDDCVRILPTKQLQLIDEV